tara:strand:- start:571 stop:1341 length:771 start_codon:yes stop_codon:yes gene_type:complete
MSYIDGIWKKQIMEKNILFIGGSTGLNMHKSFSEMILEKRKNTYNLINLSITGAGNHYIAGSFFEFLHFRPKPDYVFFKFTGLNRIDLPFNKKIIIPDYEFQSTAAKEKQPETFQQIEKNWVFSGGYAGSWLNQGILKRIFSYMYDVKDQNSTNVQSLAQVFNCLALCETLKIPYNWTFYYDPTNPPSPSSKQDGHIDHMPDYIPTNNMLETSPLNFAYMVGQIPDDGNHYNQGLFRQYLTHEPIHNKIIKTLGDI